MINKTLGQIAKMLKGEISDHAKENTIIKGISTDSRTIDKRNLYIPLVGEVYDGRIFIKECEEKGASAFLIDKDFNLNKNITIPYIIVEDTKKALIDLAKAYRSELDMKVIAITGSNGKTTCKDLLAKVLSEKFVVQKTIGNLNNEIGVPKTVLDLDPQTEIAVIELGTDNFGDISLTTDIVKPDIAAILNIGDSHLLKLKSKEGIAKAKLEIVEGLKEDGLFIYNKDDPTLRKVIADFPIKQKVLSFGLDDNSSDYKIEKKESNFNGVKFKHKDDIFALPLVGDHQLYNGAFVAMVASFLGLRTDEINKGFSKAISSKNRTELIELDGFDILDDSYKSNPQALLAGLKMAYMLNGYSKKIVVLSDMLELGDDEASYHFDIGKKIDPNNIDYCLFFGPLSLNMYQGALENFPKSRVFYFEKKADLCDKLKQLISKSTLVFVKGSHGMHMEEVIEAIRKLNI